MKTLLLILTALMLCDSLGADESIDKIYNAYSRGDIESARESLRSLPQVSTRDGNHLFMSALLEKDAVSIKDKINASLKSNIDGKYIEEAYFRLLQLAEASGDTTTVTSTGKTFLETWESSTFREQVIAMLAAHTKSESSTQNRYLGLLIDEASADYYGQFARMIKADIAFSKGRLESATKYCRRINNAVDDNLTAASLVMLSKIGLKRNNAERALFNYNILHEQYRYAIGEEELLDALRQISDSQSGQESTEVFEGISYSVQVGVFSEKENAERMDKRIEGYGYKTRIKRRQISGKSYYVVLSGKFKTMKEAQKAKARLELGEDQIFKVAVNDEK